MKKPLPIFASLLVVLTVAPRVLSAGPALAECRQIEDVEERVACYDAVVDAQAAASSSSTRETAATSGAKAPEAIPDARTLFGTSDAEAKRIIETSLNIEQVEQIEAVVTNTRQSATRKLTITLDNGQVWRQLDSQPMRLREGEAVTVRKASLGSFLMQKQSGGRSVRVKRAN